VQPTTLTGSCPNELRRITRILIGVLPHESACTVQHTIQQEIKGVVAFVAAIWAVFLLEYVLPFDLTSFGLVPRTLTGLVGIPAMPFLHANLQHILSNTVPIFILLILLAGSRANSWAVVVAVVLLSGVLLWLFGRSATHIGASSLVFGLIAFLIVSGFLERRFVPLVISVAVIFFYGGSLLLGVVPRLRSHISWDGHLFGAVAGGIIAYVLTRRSVPQAGTITDANDEG
jgi:membrane associated rhomboid family serine protease